MSYYNSEKDFLGSVIIQQLGTVSSAFTPIVVPALRVQPRNPLNRKYLPSINRSSYPTQRIQSKRTPHIALDGAFKPSWTTSLLLNNLLQTLNVNGDTAMYSIGLYQATAGLFRSWDFARCSQIELSGDATGGPIHITMDFLSCGGESELAGGTLNGFVAPTFATSSLVVDPGELTNVTQVTWGATPTVTQVHAWTLTIVRAQTFQFFDDGTIFPADVTSGQLSGVLTVEQSPNAASILSTGGTLQIGSVGAGVIFNFLLSEDDLVQEKQSGLGTVVRTYSLYDAVNGGNPIVITAA